MPPTAKRSKSIPTKAVALACLTCATLQANSFGVDEWETRHTPHLRSMGPKAGPGRQFTREAYVRLNGRDGAGVRHAEEKFLWRSCPCGSKHLTVERDGAIVMRVTLGGEA